MQLEMQMVLPLTLVGYAAAVVVTHIEPSDARHAAPIIFAGIVVQGMGILVSLIVLSSSRPCLANPGLTYKMDSASPPPSAVSKPLFYQKVTGHPSSSPSARLHSHPSPSGFSPSNPTVYSPPAVSRPHGTQSRARRSTPSSSSQHCLSGAYLPCYL